MRRIHFIPLLLPTIFLVVSMLVWAGTCPDPSASASTFDTVKRELEIKSIALKKNLTPVKTEAILDYSPVNSGEHWRPDAELIAFIKSIENHPLANGQVELANYKDYGFIAKGYGTRAKHFKKHTLEEAEQIMIYHLLESNKVVDRHVKIPLTRNQRNALVSLVYNIGPFAFSTSKALKALNKGDESGFKRQAFDPRMGFVCAGGRHNRGLVVRRAHERNIWEKGKYYTQLM
jgi:GH24 family phage-related lysozyme (muramidase)